MTQLAPRIALDVAVRFGKPCVEGTRIAVEDVLAMLGDGMSHQAIIEDFPELTDADVLACLKFSADQMSRTLIGKAA
jgi:uncharacterized protein (DUF433 family)